MGTRQRGSETARQGRGRNRARQRVSETAKQGRDSWFEKEPESREELRGWLAKWLDVEVSERGLIGGHAAPLDYLEHTFLEAPHGGPIDCAVWANRGGGKTFLGAVATALDLIFKPGIEVRIVAGSLEQGARMHAHLRAIFERPAFRGLVRGRITDRRIGLTNGSMVELLAQSQASIRGTRVQKLRCDEVELFDPELWEALQLATRSKECGGTLVRGAVECMSTMHVPYGLMSRIADEAGQGRRRLFKWGVVDVLGRCGDEHTCHDGGRDCPLWNECAGRVKERDEAGGAPGHLSVEDALVMKSRVCGATWEAEMLCGRPRRTDSVLPEFRPERHVYGDAGEAKGPDGAWSKGQSDAGGTTAVIGGMDFGFRAPTVVLWGTVEGGVLRIVDERVVAGAVIGEHIDALLESPWGVPVWVGADPSGGAVSDQTGTSSVDEMKRAGLKVRVRRLRMGEGLDLIRARLSPADGAPARLLVHARCRGLIESLEKYHYPAERPESLEPVKDGSDHAVDALRYLVVNLDRAYRAERIAY